MRFDDYVVTIFWTTPSGNPSQTTIEVMAYSKEEAEDLAFAKWSELEYEHIGVLKYETNLYESEDW